MSNEWWVVGNDNIPKERIVQPWVTESPKETNNMPLYLFVAIETVLIILFFVIFF